MDQETQTLKYPVVRDGRQLPADYEGSAYLELPAGVCRELQRCLKKGEFIEELIWTMILEHHRNTAGNADSDRMMEFDILA